jgi:hypothetical protein
MCKAAGSESRAASAAQTHESMPPLNNTTERGFSPAKYTPDVRMPTFQMAWQPE